MLFKILKNNKCINQMKYIIENKYVYMKYKLSIGCIVVEN